MAALSDHLDRLAHSTRSINSIATSCANSGTGPFTRAILTTQLGDLVRDIDSSEYGLFTITADKETRNPSGVEITRAEFHGATPLRRPTGRKDELKPKEVQPEVYAEAALKYMERYQQIRPMPQTRKQVTAILQNLEVSNKRIRSLTELLQRTQATEAQSLKAATDEEQQRIDDLSAQIAARRKHKESLLEQKPRVKRPPDNPKPKTPKPVDPVEEQFWSTPGASARPLHFSDNLLFDEEAEFGNLSIASSFSSPIPPTRFGNTRLPSPSLDSPSPSVPKSPPVTEEEVEPEEDPVPPPEQTQSDEQVVSVPEPDTPRALDTPHKERRVHVNMEVERAVAKIWSTVGELIMPGNTFNTTNNRPPVAKATISHLQSLSSLTPSTASPTHSISTASKGNAPPTSQQILTAHLLLALLSSDTLSLSFGKAKELLGEKAGTGTSIVSTQSTRVLYACVAKRLLKIDRGAGGQVVKFDI